MGTTDDELLAVAVAEISNWAAKDLDHPPDPSEWRLLAREDNDQSAILLIGTDKLRDHYMALFDWEDRAEPELIALSHQQSRLLVDNPWLGENPHIRPERHALCCYDILFIASELEPGADAVRYVRDNQEFVAEVDPKHGRYAIVDWASADPISGYTSVRVDGQWVDTMWSGLPFSTAYAAEAWDRAARNFGTPAYAFDEWIASLFFDLESDDFEDVLFELLKALDATRHEAGLSSLGAGPIYGNGHWFYDRIEEEPDVPRENLHTALLMERPEFLPEDVAVRYRALMKSLQSGFN